MNLEKEYVRPDQLFRDAFALARLVYESGYKPEVLLALWRGGTPIGAVIHEFLLYMGLPTYHATVKVESYSGIGNRHSPRVEHFEPVLRSIPANARVLVIDDIFDTGHTLEAVCERLRTRTSSIKIATLYLKRSHGERAYGPDFWLHCTDRWIVFPHEMVGLTIEEIREKDEFLYEMLRAMSRPSQEDTDWGRQYRTTNNPVGSVEKEG
ncbi:MAG: phosphoribosyltransferase family protein [Kiritimatiellae bacterium]|nr:phosphoribosyltransferase family protein [Kiritimatiellia bacterium]